MNLKIVEMDTKTKVVKRGNSFKAGETKYTLGVKFKSDEVYSIEIPKELYEEINGGMSKKSSKVESQMEDNGEEHS